MITLLQFKNPKFDNFINVFGFLLALLSMIHILYYTSLLIRRIRGYYFEKTQKENILYCQSPSQIVVANRYYTIFIIFLKFFLVTVIIFGNYILFILSPAIVLILYGTNHVI